MKYVSTRGQAPEADFQQALLTGLASDGGLYVPLYWPQFSAHEIAAMAGLAAQLALAGAIGSASGPLSRTTPTPPSPGGVACDQVGQPAHQRAALAAATAALAQLSSN